MTKFKFYDFEENMAKTYDFESDYFDIEVNAGILHFVVDAYLSNKRAGTACTKTRTEVAGSGKKPWKQKGTGRARSGSAQSPLWKGGGVAFGPKPRDFFKKVNKKVKRLALRMALASKVEDTTIIKGFDVAEPKTKIVTNMLKKANLSDCLIVLNEVSNSITLATNNVRDIKLINIKEINVYDVLKYKNICIENEVLVNLGRNG